MRFCITQHPTGATSLYCCAIMIILNPRTNDEEIAVKVRCCMAPQKHIIPSLRPLLPGKVQLREQRVAFISSDDSCTIYRSGHSVGTHSCTHHFPSSGSSFGSADAATSFPCHRPDRSRATHLQFSSIPFFHLQIWQSNVSYMPIQHISFSSVEEKHSLEGQCDWLGKGRQTQRPSTVIAQKIPESIQESIKIHPSFGANPTIGQKLAGLECLFLMVGDCDRVGLLWVCCSPRYPTSSLLQLADRVSDVMLRSPRLLVMGVFNIFAKAIWDRLTQYFLATMTT